MLSLGGGGATQGLCGAFDLYCSIAFPTLGNLTKNLGPGGEAFAFFCADEWDQGTSSCARLCASQLGIEVAQLKSCKTVSLFLIEISICFYIIQKHLFSLFNFNIN